MSTIVDTNNVVNSLETAPDKLRAEIGTFYSGARTSDFTNFKNFNLNLDTRKTHIVELESNEHQLIPTRKARIYIVGRESDFRDQEQWRSYIQSSISEGSRNLDHQFS